MKFLGKTLEYDHVDHQVIIKNEKNEVVLTLFWQLAEIREDPSVFITNKEFKECLAYYALDPEDLEEQYIKDAQEIQSKLENIFGWELWDKLNLPY